MSKKITFIIRAKGNFNATCRCINSIKRQTVDSYKIMAFVYNETAFDNLQSLYPEVKFKLAKDDKNFKNKFNSLIHKIKTKYCMLVDSDSVLTPNAAETVLQHEEDLVIFNISKINTANKFEPYYSKFDLVDEASFMKQNQSVWAVAFRPDFISKNEIKLKGFRYPKQALFLLLCMSLSKTTAFHRECLVYKHIVTPGTPITVEFFQDNKNEIKRAMKGFTCKGNKEAKIQLIKNFLLADIEESYSLSFFKRLKRAIPVIKLMWFS